MSIEPNTIESLSMQTLVIIACILLACSVIENKFKKNAKRWLT